VSKGVQAGNRRGGSGRVTPSKLRRSAVIAVDGVLALGTGALAGLFATGPAAAQAPNPGWTGIQGPLPSAPDGPGTNPSATFNSENCISAVTCVAAGSYADGSNVGHGLLDVLSGGSWSSVEAPLPSNGDDTSDASLSSVSCANAGWCVAVGEYTDMSGGRDGLVETYAGGRWMATQAPVPSDALGGTNAEYFLKSVSCPGVGDCTAVGGYKNPSGGLGLVDSLSGGSWSTQPAPTSPGAAGSTHVSLDGVSCPAVGGCAATGVFENASSHIESEVLAQAVAGGAWAAQDAPLPSDTLPPAAQESELLSVSCATGFCEAAGIYAGTGSNESPLLDRLAGGVWSTTPPPPLPDNVGSGSNHAGAVLAVSCAFDGCVAVGTYVDSGGGRRPLAETVSSTGAVSAAEGPQPGDAASGSSTNGNFTAVSCLSMTDCVAGGDYRNTVATNRVALLDNLSGGTWSTVPAPVPSTAGTGAAAQSDIGAVSCSSRGACDAAGTVWDPGGNHLPLLESYTPPEGYWNDASDGGIFSYGSAVFHGSMGGQHLNAPMVGMAETPGPGGYWEVGSDGGIFTFGNAVFHGSTGSLRLNAPIVGMAGTPDGGGYWLVATDGGIFNYGDAGFYGSAGSIHLNKPIVGMAPTPDGHGYWLVASDGGIFTYGDAVFHGSAGSIPLNKPVVGMASDASGFGYWLVASDGGIFTYGDAGFLGSRGGQPLNKPIVGMMSSFDGAGYWLVASDGGIFGYGDTGFYGSAGSLHLNAPVVGGTPS